MIEGKTCIVLFGLAGSGKGTQADLLEANFNVLHVSPGEIIRSMLKEGTLPKEIEATINSGKLVDTKIVADLTLGIVRNRLKDKNIQICLFDGFPRNEEQEEAFKARLKPGESVDLAIYLEMDKEVLIERLKGRIQCKRCGAIFNTKTNPTKVAGVCDECGGTDLISRADDAEVSAINNRFKVFINETMEVIERYKKDGVLHTIQADQSIQQVFKEVMQIVDKFVGIAEGASSIRY